MFRVTFKRDNQSELTLGPFLDVVLLEDSVAAREKKRENLKVLATKRDNGWYECWDERIGPHPITSISVHT